MGSGAKTLNFRYSPQFIFIPEVLMDKLKDFKWKHFQPDIILLCVRWYLRYSLSYRDLVEMMEERGLSLAHTTIMRWIHEYAPKIDKRTRPKLRQTGDSWMVDETYVKVKGKWMYLYRAVDKVGASIDFYLSAHRDHLAAARFFKKALTAKHTTLPRVINVDKAASYPPAVESAKAAGYLPDETILRQVKYLNNGVEGDHMPMKRLIAPTISIFAPGPQNARTAASKTVLKP